MFKKRLDFFRSLLIIGDLCLVAATWLAAYYIRFYAPVIPVTKGVPDPTLYLALLGLVLGVYLLTFHISGLYHRPWAGFWQYLWPVLRATTLGVVISITVTYFVRPYDFSRLVFMHFYVLITIALLAYRILLRTLWKRFAAEGYGEGVLIVGVGDLGRLVAGKIAGNPILGMQVRGYLTKHEDMLDKQVDGVPVLGLYEQVQEVLAEHSIQVVIIALPLSAHERILDVVNNIADEMVDIKVVPDLFRYVTVGGSVEEFEGLPFIGLRGSPMEGWARVAKRATDLLGSALGLIISSPVLLALALAVKLGSKGPVFYKQQRMGLDGKLFTMIKFRSMRMEAEKDCGPVWACQDDPRRTRVGTFMRRTSLDELPQLWNVLKGEMSLVGPRPERPEFIGDFRKKVPGYMLRHKMKAGITGWAQINGWRGNTSLTKRIEHDIYYIENWSLLLDFKILVLTPLRGLIHPNAY